MTISQLIIEQEYLNNKIQNEFKPLYGEMNRPIVDGPFDFLKYFNSKLKLFFILEEAKRIETNNVFQHEAKDLKHVLIDTNTNIDIDSLNYNFEIYHFLKLTTDLINEKQHSLASYSINNMGLIFLNKIPNNFSNDNYSFKNPVPSEIIKEYQNKYLYLIIDQLAFYKPNFVVCMKKTFKAISTTFIDYDDTKINYEIKYIATYYDKTTDCNYIIVSDSISSFKIMGGYIVDFILRNIEKK